MVEVSVNHCQKLSYLVLYSVNMFDFMKSKGYDGLHIFRGANNEEWYTIFDPKNVVVTGSRTP